MEAQGLELKKIIFILIFTSSLLYSGNLSYENDEEKEYTCDDRKHCSEMTSCEEAIFFVNNCPDTKMDGDNDGKPCERGCGH